MNLLDDLRASIEEALRETGGSMAKSGLEVARYAATRTFDLARAVAGNEPGIDEARRAAVNSTVAFAAVSATTQADQLDARLRGIVEMGLRVGAGALAAALGVPPVA